jgi:hypothetical protein
VESGKVKAKSPISTGFLRVLPQMSHIFWDFCGFDPYNTRNLPI